jgi:hypothetical protein
MMTDADIQWTMSDDTIVRRTGGTPEDTIKALVGWCPQAYMALQTIIGSTPVGVALYPDGERVNAIAGR